MPAITPQFEGAHASRPEERPAVHHEGLAGEVPARVRAEEQHHRGDVVLWVALAPDGVILHVTLGARPRSARPPPGPAWRTPRAQSRDHDAVSTPFPRRRASEGVDRLLDAPAPPYSAMPVMPAAEPTFTMRPHPASAMLRSARPASPRGSPSPRPSWTSSRPRTRPPAGPLEVNVCALLTRPSTRPNGPRSDRRVADPLLLADVGGHAEGPRALPARPPSGRCGGPSQLGDHHPGAVLRQVVCDPRPMPWPAPVTMTTRPSTSCIVTRRLARDRQGRGRYHPPSGAGVERGDRGRGT